MLKKVLLKVAGFSAGLFFASVSFSGCTNGLDQEEKAGTFLSASRSVFRDECSTMPKYKETKDLSEVQEEGTWVPAWSDYQKAYHVQEADKSATGGGSYKFQLTPDRWDAVIYMRFADADPSSRFECDLYGRKNSSDQPQVTLKSVDVVDESGKKILATIFSKETKISSDHHSYTRIKTEELGQSSGWLKFTFNTKSKTTGYDAVYFDNITYYRPEENIIPVETDEIIVNPDIGFYRTINEQFEAAGLATDEYIHILKKPVNPQIFSSTAYKDVKIDSSQYSDLTHLIIDLSYFSARGRALKPVYLKYKAQYKDYKSKSDKTDLVELCKTMKKEYEANLKNEKDIENLNLTGLSTILKELRKQEKTTVIRFIYDPCNAGVEIYKWKDEKDKSKGTEHDYYDYEPKDFACIINNEGHINQICKAIAPYTDVITAVECGLIGPWGEMHGTTYGDGKMTEEEFKSYAEGRIEGSYSLSSVLKKGSLEKGHSILVMRKFLEEMDKFNIDCPLLLRYPITIYSYMAIFEDASLNNQKDIPSKYDTEANRTSLSYRIGMYNDGYLGSYSDYGTFKIVRDEDKSCKTYADKIANSRRPEEVEFLEPFLRHTAYGGELITRESTDKPAYWELSKKDGIKYTDCEEMKIVHLSYLNISHSPKAFSELDTSAHTYGKQTVFHYILSHMGYRYVISNTDNNPVTASGENVSINLTVKNEGFAELPYHRGKGFKVYLVKAGTEPSGKEKALNASGEFRGDYSKADTADIEHVISTEVSASSFPAGTYDVYLKVCNVSSDAEADGKYAIRFANKGIWNETLKANRIGSVTLK